MKRPSRRFLLTALVTVVVAVVAAYVAVRVVRSDETTIGDQGEGPYADYCAEVQRQQPAISAAVAVGGAEAFIQMLPSYEALSAKAPGDVVDEWALIVARVDRLRDAFESAGIDPAGFDLSKPPEGATDGQVATISTALEGMLSAETATALSTVQQQVLDVCHVPLSL